MEIEISWLADANYHPKTFVLWDYDPIDWKVNPDRRPTEEELSACPKIFTCFCCLEKHSVDKLGGRYHEKWFCSGCIPFLDEWAAGAMVWWEERRKSRHFGFPKHIEKPPAPNLGDGDEFRVPSLHDGEKVRILTIK